MQIQGAVVHGKEEARTLGYPTANIEYISKNPPLPGVWTCFIDIDGVAYQGLAVVGMWKLSTGEPSVEVYVFNFQNDIYGKVVQINFGKRLRSLQKFETVQALKRQIKEDVQQGEEWFESEEGKR